MAGCQPVAIASGTAERISQCNCTYHAHVGVRETTVPTYFTIHLLTDTFESHRGGVFETASDRINYKNFYI